MYTSLVSCVLSAALAGGGPACLVATHAVHGPCSPAAPLAAAERAELAALEGAHLGALRAGATLDAAALDAAERGVLAEHHDGELAALRAGEITNSELTTILLVLGIIVLALIIL